MKTTQITGVDVRAIEKTVRAEYEANKEAWEMVCGIGKPFPTIFDLIDVKEKALKAKAVAQIGLARSALMSLRIKRFLRMVEEGDVLDVTMDEVQDYLNAKGA